MVLEQILAGLHEERRRVTETIAILERLAESLKYSRRREDIVAALAADRAGKPERPARSRKKPESERSPRRKRVQAANPEQPIPPVTNGQEDPFIPQ